MFRAHIKMKFHWQSALLAVGTALIAVVNPSTAAPDFSTINTGLEKFRSAFDQSNRPVTVVSFGDSMADSYQSATYHLMNRLNEQFGSAGYSLNNYHNTAMWKSDTGVTVHEPDYYWFDGYLQIPAGSSVWWEDQPDPGGVLCDRAGIFYVSQTNGGPFRLLLSTNGGPWVTALTLNGYSVAPQGWFTNLPLPLNRYRLRVESDVGTNFIIGTSTVATHSSGIHSVFINWPGITLGQVTSVPLSIRAPIFAGVNPDLLIWHMKEWIPGLSNELAACESWWKDAAPNCDVIYIGTPRTSADATNTSTVDQNTIVRSVAQEYGRAYADLMEPTISYDWMVAQGYMADGTHLNSAGGLFCANILWDELGFFALGLDRRITVQRDGALLQVSYNTSTRAQFRLEISTDRRTWLPVLTNQVATTRFITNFIPASSPAFFRLDLTPP